MDNAHVIMNQLTEGLRELPTDSVTRVRHFLAEYLGSQQHPVPFGGRVGDFARLDAWLDDAQASPYALLAAPAGRGKSALLLRWCQRLLARSDLAVVYFPVSIRFRTNLAGVVFPSLVALLARMHGEKVPADPNMHEEVWHNLFLAYLTRPLPDGRGLVLVLDGIDEAADWDVGVHLFSADPPPGVRVMLSARYLANDRDASAWLQRLGWVRPGLARTFELYPLDRAGISSVLVQMGFPLDLLGTRVDIVAEMHRLSEGDPLLIRLYVDDLWERGEKVIRLQPGELYAIRPGLPGYFERWWDDQRMLWNREAPEREATLQAVLNLLAGALGPLSKEDILELAHDEIGLRADAVEQHLEPLARFVIGDGMRQGYVFSHPRLANYFLEERLSVEERQTVEGRFLAWGERTLTALNAGSLPPEQASAYVVQYYGAHLERAQATASALQTLVSDGWRRAWEKLDRANAGFLNDSERAWRATERENAEAIEAGHQAPYLSAEIRSLLCRVSINSMTSNISPRLMLEAVKTGVWTVAQGLACIRLIADLAPRARELVGLASYVQEPLRTDILQEALDTAATIKDEYARLDALVELAPGLSENLLSQVLAMVPPIEDEADRAGVLSELAPALARYPLLVEQALNITRELVDEEYLAMALAGLAPFFSSEQYGQSLQLAREIQSERYRAQALTALIPHLSSDLLEEILQETRLMRDGLSRVRLLTALVICLPEQLQKDAMQEALDLMHDIDDLEYRVEVLLGLAACLPEDELRKAVQEAQQLWDEGARARALNALLPYLPADQLDAFLQATQVIRNEEFRSVVLLQLLPRLSTDLHEQALSIVEATWDEGCQVEILARLAPLLSANMLPAFLKLVENIQDLGYRVWLLAELEITLLGKSSALSFDITRTFLVMKDEEEREQTLLAIVHRLSAEALTNILDYMLPQLFGFRWSVKSPDRRADVLAKLCSYLPAEWLPRVMKMVQELGSDIYQVRVLVALAPRVGEIALSEVLDIVRGMQEREKRAQVLEVLVSSLPVERKGERVREMLQILQVIKDEQERAHLSAEYASQLPSAFPEERVPLILAGLRAILSETNRLSILRELVPHLPESLFGEVLAEIQTIHDEAMRVRGLLVLASHVPEHVLPAFLSAIQGIRSERRRAQLLSLVVTCVPGTLFPDVLELVQDIQDESERTKTLITLVQYTPADAFELLWAAVQKIKDEGRRVRVLGTLVPRVSETFFSRLWKALRKLQNQQGQMWVIRALASDPEQRFFAQLWPAIQGVPDEIWRLNAIRALANYIPESFYGQVFQAVQAIADEDERVETLNKLLAGVPESEFPGVFQVVQALYIEEQRWGWVMLLTLTAHVPESFFPRFWQFMLLEQDEEQQSMLLRALVSRVPESFFAQCWETINGPLQRALRQGNLLEALVTSVPESYVPQFLEVVNELPEGQRRARLFRMLLPRLSSQRFTEMLRAIRGWTDESELALDILERQILYFSAEQCAALLETLISPQEEQPTKVLEALRATWSPGRWVRILGGLVPRLPEGKLLALLPRLLQALRSMHGHHEQSALLEKLAVNIPESILPEMLETIWTLHMPQDRIQVLAALIPRLSPQEGEHIFALLAAKTYQASVLSVLAQALHLANALSPQVAYTSLYSMFCQALHLLGQCTRREALPHLALLAPVAHILGGETALVEIYCSTLEIGAWWP